MVSRPATMAVTAPDGEALESRPFLAGARAAAAGILVVGAAVLLVAPALVATGSFIDAGAVGRAAAWLERLGFAAPALLTMRTLVAVVAVVVITRSDGQA